MPTKPLLPYVRFIDRNGNLNYVRTGGEGITRKEIAHEVADDLGLTRDLVDQVSRAYFEKMKEKLNKHRRLFIHNFGIFSINKRKGHYPGRNVTSVGGNPLGKSIPTINYVRFKPIKAYYKEIQNLIP